MIFRRRKASASARLLESIDRYLDANWEGRRRVLLEQPKLLEPDTERSITSLAAAMRREGHLGSSHDLEALGTVLRRAQRVGVERALAEAASGDRGVLPWDLVPLVQDQHELQAAPAADAEAHLDALTVAWRRIVEHPAFAEAPVEARAGFLTNASAVFVERFELRGEPDDLERAVAAAQEALALTPSNAPEYAGFLVNLGNALRDRYYLRGEPDDLDGAVDAFEEAVRRSPAEPMLRAMAVYGLGVSLRRRYDRDGRIDDLERAEGFAREAVKRTPSGARRRDALAALATTLAYRAELTGDRAAVEDAIASLEQALEITAPHARHASLLSELAIFHRIRWRTTGELADLEREIRLLLEAEAKAATGSPAWRMILGNLAGARGQRYQFTQDPEDLDEAVTAARLALDAAPSFADVRAKNEMTLGETLLLRSEKRDDLADLREAVDHLRRGVATGSGRVQAVRSAAALAQGLLELAERTQDEEALREALDVAQAGATQAPQADRAKAQCLRLLGRALGRLEVYEPSVAGSAEAGRALREAADLGLRVDLPNAIAAAWEWAEWAAERDAWEEAGEAYGLALEATERLHSCQLERRHIEIQMRMKSSRSLAAEAAYAYAQAGDSDSSALALERGRAVALSEALALQARELRRLPSMGRADLLERYRAAAARTAPPDMKAGLVGLGMSSAAVGAAVAEAGSADLEAVVSEIRSLSGFERFLAPLTVADLHAAAQKGEIVYLAAARRGGLAIIVPPDGPSRYVPLPGASRGVLMDHWAEYVQIGTGEAEWRPALDRLTYWLWEAVMGPVMEALQRNDGVILIAGELFGVLPLHAAWREDPEAPTGRRYALDDALLTYVPNARALVASQDRAADTGASRLLAVEDPQSDAADPLPFAAPEVAAALRWFPDATHLSGEEATREAVESAMPEHDLLHFACHGASYPGEPMLSHLLLAHDERLAMVDVLDARLGRVRLAVLSACETALPGAFMLDEVVGLPSGLLESGVAGVVCSLWTVPDASTMMLMARLYEFWRGEGRTPAEALREAQCWLRDATNGEKRQRFGSDAGSAPASSAREVWQTARAHYHPYHWAAFTYVGA